MRPDRPRGLGIGDPDCCRASTIDRNFRLQTPLPRWVRGWGAVPPASRRDSRDRAADRRGGACSAGPRTASAARTLQ